MDHGSFDRIARLLGSAGSRRAALGALISTSLAGTLGAAEAAKKKDRGRKRKSNKKSKGGADVSAQAADCLSPGPSSNISGCPFQDDDFSFDDLSGSRMVGTNFRGAELVGTDLSSSNAKNAVFREANLSCADLRSSTLGGADFRAANLTGANLKSSGGCNTATFNAATTFCGTVMCDGSIRNDDCTGPFVGGQVCLQPQQACTVEAQCEDDGTGTTRCEDVPMCTGLLQCCRQTGGSCSTDCDCCDDDFCGGGVCVD